MATILIVDDDIDIVEAVSMILEEEGYRVLTATTEDDARALAAAHHPGLLLVDYRIPGVDVGALIEDLRHLAAPEAIIALCTAADAAEDLARRTGADRVLAKPFEIDDLLALARQATRPHTEPVVTP